MPLQIHSIDDIPWPFRIFAIIFVAQFLLPVWKWYRKNRTESWPITDARINGATVTDKKGAFIPRNQYERYDGELEYSYSVGESFTGHYKQSFETEEEAAEFIRDMEGKPIAVHYDPDKPSSSALSQGDVEALLANRAPAPPGVRTGKPSRIPAWAVVLLWPLAALSALGFAISLCVHIAALMGYNVLPKLYFAAMHAGIFVVFSPAVLVMMGLPRPMRIHNSYWDRVRGAIPGAPPALQVVLSVLTVYAVVNFVLAFGSSFVNGSKNAFDADTVRGFSGHWMVFYFASLTMFVAALNTIRNSPRCSSGHLASAGDAFCEKCGGPVSSSR